MSAKARPPRSARLPDRVADKKPTMMASKERRGIQSADKSSDVLLALVDAGGAAPLRDLAHTLGMPASLVHRYLASLVASGLAVQNQASGLYDLGPSALRIGAAALARVDALHLTADAMPELVAATRLTALLNVLGDRGPTIVRWERNPVPFFTTLAVGSVLPLTGSASGRAILAFTPERVRGGLIAASLEPGDNEAEAKLSDRLSQIRKRGYDTTDSTVVPGLSAISAPILDLQNEAVASLTLIGGRADVARAGDAAIAQLLQTATRISRRCGSSLTFGATAAEARFPDAAGKTFRPPRSRKR
jgi:DNA-binding IclR family transcriptional regulator